ncbi:hypothetical protein RFI_22441, partial [Reticulomyxa filosa]
MLTFVLLRDWINKGKLSILFCFIVHQIVQCFFIGYFNFVYDKEFSPKLLFLQQTLFASKEVKIIRNLKSYSLCIVLEICYLYLLNKKIHFNFLLTLKKKSKSIFFIIFTSSKIISRKKRRYFSLVMKVSFKFFLGFSSYFSHFALRLKQSKEEIQIIIHHWTRTLNIQLGWIKDFDKFIVNYVNTIFMFDTFRSSSKLINTFTGHTDIVWSIDYSTYNDCQFICSGSYDQTVRVWDVDNNKLIQSFNGHTDEVYCVKFSPYHYHNHHQNVICSSSDENIRFWDFKHNKQLQIFNGHTSGVSGIEFSPFNGGRYLCSGSFDKTIRLWDVETSKSLHVLMDIQIVFGVLIFHHYKAI